MQLVKVAVFKGDSLKGTAFHCELCNFFAQSVSSLSMIAWMLAFPSGQRLCWITKSLKSVIILLRIMIVPFYFTHWSSLAVISFQFNLRKLFILFSFNLEVLREVTLPDSEASPSSLIWFLLNWLNLTFPDALSTNTPLYLHHCVIYPY